MITAGARRLAKGIVELAYDERGYQLPGRCLICLEPETVRRPWRTRTQLGGSLPGGRHATTVREYSLDLSLPYCARHVQLYDQTKVSFEPPWPSITQAGVPGFSARVSGQIDLDAMAVRGVTVELRFGDASYAKEVAAVNLPRLREILSDTFGLAEQVRATQVLAEIGDASAAESIAAAALASFSRSDRSVDLGGLDVVDAPFAMARELGRLGESATGPLARMLEDDRPDVRRAAVQYGLAQVGTSSGVELLSQAIRDDPHDRVRAAAATSLGRYLEDPKSRDALEKASEDPSRKVRSAAKKALKRGA